MNDYKTREIKFRAWHKREKKMYFVRNIELFSSSFPGVVDWRVTIDGLTDKLGFYITSDYGELMQYTGLKDKNGKEIYESDLIRFRVSLIETKQVISEVEYTAPAFTVSIGEQFKRFGLLDVHEIEVIGNIYENPELLVTK